MNEGVRHLDAETYRRFVADPTADRVLFAHVEQGCDTCDAVIAQHVDAIDGAIDRALLSLAPLAPAPLDEVGWQRLKRRLNRPAARWRLVLTALAAVLVALVAARMMATPQSPASDGIKGSVTTGPTFQLVAARQSGVDAFSRIDDGATVAASSVVVFRATSSVDGPGRVFLQRADASPVEVGQIQVKAGTHELTAESGLMGVTLDGEKGELKVWVVVGEAPFSAAAALDAIQSAGSPELGVARVHLRVE